MRRGAALAVLAAGVLIPPAWAGNDHGLTAAPFLTVPQGARAIGMAGAYDAPGDDLYSIGFNPAGVALLQGGELAANYHGGLEDINSQFVALGVPIPGEILSGEGSTILGLSGLLNQNGAIEVNKTNPDGSFLSSDSFSAGSDMALGLTLAQRVMETVSAHGDAESHTQHFFGLTGKYIQSTLAKSYTAKTFAGDMGYLVRMPEAGLALSLSALNLGGKLVYVSRGDPLPTSYRAGAAYAIPLGAGSSVTLTGSGEYRDFDDFYIFGAGFEYAALDSYFLRGGYRFNSDTSEATFGFGIRAGAFQIDYGFESGSVFSNQHRVSLLYRFSTPWGRPQAHKRPYVEDLSVPPEIEKRRIVPATPLPADHAPQNPPQEGAPGWIY